MGNKKTEKRKQQRKLIRHEGVDPILVSGPLYVHESEDNTEYHMDYDVPEWALLQYESTALISTKEYSDYAKAMVNPLSPSMFSDNWASLKVIINRYTDVTVLDGDEEQVFWSSVRSDASKGLYGSWVNPDSYGKPAIDCLRKIVYEKALPYVLEEVIDYFFRGMGFYISNSAFLEE